MFRLAPGFLSSLTIIFMAIADEAVVVALDLTVDGAT